MNGSPAHSSLIHLARWSLIGAVGVLSLAVLGATQASPKPAFRHHAAAAVVSAPVAPLRAETPGPELMQNVPLATIPSHVGNVEPGKKVIWVVVTAYCGCPKCCGPNAHGLTASGRTIAYNGGEFVAADTHLFKFGTRFEIPGYAGGQPVEVIDRGGAIKGYHLDIFFSSHERAMQWGRKWMAVTVVE